MSQKVVNVTLNIDGYKNLLQQELHTHISKLRLVVDSAGKFDITAGKGFFSWTIAQPDIDSLVQSQVDDCYKAMISSLQDYLDRLLTAIRITEEPIRVETSLKSREEISVYIQTREQEMLKAVATDKTLKVPVKLIKILGQDKTNIDYIQSYFDLRNAYEHHKGLPEKVIKLNYRKVILKVDNGTEVVEPTRVEAGQMLSVAFEDTEKHFLPNERAILSVEELDNIAHTILLYISPILMNSAIQKIKGARDVSKLILKI